MTSKVMLVGRLGSDIDTKTLDSGLVIANVSIACRGSWKGKDGKYATNWIKLSFFGKLAETASNYLSKGSLVSIVGELMIKTYEKDGVKKSSTEVRVESMEMLVSKDGNKGNINVGGCNNSFVDDDVPF